MKNYVFIYYNNGTRDNVSAEEAANTYKAWFGRVGDKLVDAGNPFNTGAQAVTKDGATDVKDMPATGYTIVRAVSMDEALALAKDCPILDEPEGAVCVYEALPM